MLVDLRSLLVVFVLIVTPARAEVPKVVTDIAPVHALVALVMQGLGTPDFLVTPQASAHGAALRPSQARMLHLADLVVWIGPELTPRLQKPVTTLAANARRVDLLSAPGTILLDYRGTPEDGHEHDSEGGYDPHAWLDPVNGQHWLGLIAEVLAEMDPANAVTYRTNARVGQDDLAQVQADLSSLLEPMKTKDYVTFHDSYQYFETRFGLTPLGSVSSGDATKPGPSRISDLRATLAKKDQICAFGAPQLNLKMLTVVAGDDNQQIILLDPIGVHLEPGPELYPQMLRDMGRAFESCFTLKQD